MGPPDESDITLVTQLSADRFQRLERIMSIWGGPMSVAIYIKDVHADVQLLEQWRARSRHARQLIDFHLLFNNGGQYPANALRNLAMGHVRTDFLLLLDVDLIPTSHIYSALRNVRGEMGSKDVFVLPAFEILNDTTHTLPS